MTIHHPSPRRPPRGFTLVELITVMVIVGILAAVAATRYFDRTVFDTASYAEQMKSLIRYGQKVAVAQNRPVHVRLDGSSVALCFEQAAGACPVNSRVLGASGSNSGADATLARCAGSTTWACEGAPNNVAYTSAPSTEAFYFDALGRPVSAGGFTRTVLSVGGASSRTITIEQETGYVY